VSALGDIETLRTLEKEQDHGCRERKARRPGERRQRPQHDFNQGVKTEVSRNSDVIVYTNEEVQTSPGLMIAAPRGTQISIGEDFNTIALNGVTIGRTADGHLFVSTPGTVITKPGPANVGDVEPDGDNKGEIYGGIWSKEAGGDNKPIWFSAAPELMTHFGAAAWAEWQGGSLPTRRQGDYLDTIKDQGAFKTLFNRSGSFPAGYVWLAESTINLGNPAWCQRLSDGAQNLRFRDYELPVLCVRRASP
jgi:hypothetical protein